MRPRLTLWGVGILILGFSSLVDAVQPFKDIPHQHWAKRSVERLVEMGIASGYQDETFRGRKSVTRYELALYLSNFEHVQAKQIRQLQQEIQELRLEIKALKSSRP